MTFYASGGLGLVTVNPVKKRCSSPIASERSHLLDWGGITTDQDYDEVKWYLLFLNSL